MTEVSIRPTQSYSIASIGKNRQSTIVESTCVDIDTIRNAYRRRLELSVGVLVVHDFVDGDDGVDGEFTVAAVILPRLQHLPDVEPRIDGRGADLVSAKTLSAKMLFMRVSLRKCLIHSEFSCG